MSYFAPAIIRHTLRSLIGRPGFTSVVVLSLAFGVTASTVTFYAVDRFLLRPVDVEGLSELVEVSLVSRSGGEGSAISYPGYRRYRETDAFTGLAVVSDIELTVKEGDLVEQVEGEIVSPNYFELLGVESALGRTFRAEEADRPVTVLSMALWHRRFAGDPEIIGRSVSLNGEPYTVIGVAREGFRGLRLAEPASLWIPVETFPLVATGFMAQIPVLEDRGIRWLRGVGRLRAGVARPAAADVLTQSVRGFRGDSGDRGEAMSAQLTPLAVTALGRDRRQQIESLLRLLGALVFFELLITASNLSGMFLVRGLQQRRESAVRLSLGASRFDLMARLLIEGFLLTLVGTALGLVLARGFLTYLSRLELPSLPAITGPAAAIGPVHFAFAVVVAAALALAFAIPSAWKLSWLDPAQELKASGARFGTMRVDLRRFLIAAQVATALVLLVGTGLLVRSLAKAWRADLGFRTADILVAELNLGPSGYSEPRAAVLYRELRARLNADPRFKATAWAARRPLGRGKIDLGIEVLGRGDGGEREQVLANVVSPGYFETLGIPIEAGRGFTSYDRANTHGVAVISAAMARRYWEGGDALGGRITIAGSEHHSLEVIGVASDVKVQSQDEQPIPYLYLPLDQHLGFVGLSRMYLLARTSSAPGMAVPVVRSRLKSLDPKVAILSSQSLQDAIRRRFATQQVGVIVLGMLSIFAALMVAAGVYGLLAAVVAQQRGEISVRMALGAMRGQVLRMIIVRTLTPVLVGVLIGIAAASIVLRLASSLLYGVSPFDLPSFAASLVLILSISLFASYLPARRAARIDPAAALREG